MSKLSVFPPPPEVRSTLFKHHPSDVIPPTSELEQLHTELRILKQKVIERSHKAENDLRIVEDSLRRMKEKEANRSVDKIKREHDYSEWRTSPFIALYTHNPSKPRQGSIPLAAGSSSARASVDPRLSEEKKKKKKRKRELEDDDLEQPDTQRPRKGSPASHTSPSKLVSTSSSSSLPRTVLPVMSATAQPKQGTIINGVDFSLPENTTNYRALLPTRPEAGPPPLPPDQQMPPNSSRLRALPLKAVDVKDDFSKLKIPTNQVGYNTFYASIEPYIRPIREEDVGYLEFPGDDVEPYIIPHLGRRYTEQWADQDKGLVVDPATEEANAAAALVTAPVPTWDPSTMTDADLTRDDHGHGPLTERVISALISDNSTVWKGVKAAEDAMEGRPGGSAAAAARKEKMNVKDLEGRVRDTMRWHGLLEDTPNYAERTDDPIATALRHAQSELRVVSATNKARKARLASIARDRLAYQEYLDVRESLDRSINNLYSRAQRKDIAKHSDRRKKEKRKSVPKDEEPEEPRQCPAALGLGPDENNTLFVTRQLQDLVRTRREWVEQVGSIFEEKEVEQPGRIHGFPPESVFANMEDEIAAFMVDPPKQPPPPARS
ncbi:histone acetyltransferases subunit 3-domain-containing protein [Schizophyllum fasciatum]